ncbi:MAG: hypothetical protein OXE03_04980, partial [Gammaproteobacteria bacterium]|nr:hypothetical protein [Gammaproteobacteria bacterium]
GFWFIVNTDSGLTRKVFTSNRNQCSRSPEYAFHGNGRRASRVSMSLLPGRTGQSGHIAREGRQGRGE